MTGFKPLALPLAGGVLFWVFVALLLHGFTSLLSRLSSLKKYSAKQLIVSSITNTFSVVSAGGKTATRAALYLTVWWTTILVLFLFFSTLYVTYTDYPETWTGAVRGYNQYAAPFIHKVILVSLRVIDLFLRGLIPIWNSFFWALKTIGIQGFLPIVIEQIEALVDMAMAMFTLISHSVQEFTRFLLAFACSGKACLQPERAVVDVLTTMADVRDITVHALRVGKSFCSTLAAPMDAIFYPLLDLNLAEAVHNLVNALIQFFVVVPWFTTLRCAEKEDNQFAVLMCTPDLSPTFNFLVATMNSLGLLIDNWINVVLLIVETVVGGNPPECASAVDNAMIPDLLAADPVFAASRDTVLVGLTDWLYSVTDGATAVYTGHGSQARIARWPYTVDPSFGVAAVMYSQLHDLDVSTFSSGKTSRVMQTTAMLGCNCSDTAAGLVVTCAILPMSGIPSEAARENYLLQVLFSDALASGLYVCAGVDLYVKSVRWSYTRYETKTSTLGSSTIQAPIPTNDCISRNTCRQLDATIWLVPRCGQDTVSLNAPTACISTAPCMPFCMAARATGTGPANLVFVRAAGWRTGATVLGQDCALNESTPGTIQLGVPTGPDVSASRASSYLSALLQTAPTEVYGFSSKRVCTRAAPITSFIQKNLTRVSYNVQLTGQPFVIAGDTILTTIDLGGGAESVQVERLEGDETDVFSLNPINQELPALPKAVVPLDESERNSESRVSIPYSYQTTRIAATYSRNYLFYASNPNADVLGPYLEYCANKNDPDKLSKFGLLFLSSYSQIRVYRVSAYRRCSTYSCGQDLVRFVTFAGFSRRFSRECTEVFNVSVRALEYLNEDNIAVTVLSSKVTTWDARTAEFANATARTYWLNPATMRIKDTIWQADAGSNVSTGVPQLCPELQRLPRIGTFAAKVVNAGLFLIRYVVFAVSFTPGLVSAWSAGPRCPDPGSALAHSALASCGETAFSLDDFFDSLDDATAVFWHSLTLVARLITPNNNNNDNQPEAARVLTNVLDGMAQYGQGAVDVWAGGRAVLYLVKVPVREQAAQLFAVIRAGTAGDAGRMIEGLALPGAGVIAWGRFVYRVFSSYGLVLLKRFLDPLQDITLGQAFTLFWAGLYDMQKEFSETVTSRVRLACGGIKLIFGVDNPWADFLYHQCASGAEMSDGMLALVVNIFVQIPMAKCVCKDSAGQDVSRFVTQRCAPSLPVSLLPTIYSVANQAMGTVLIQSMACERVLDSVKASISGSLDPWFSHQFLSMDALGSAVDYATGVFDDEAGKCLDFQNDPHVVVIVPQPVDYFQRCGGTSLCKQVCSAEWQAFQQAKQEIATGSLMRAPETVKTTVESLFFPGQLDGDLVLTNATAVVELKPGQGGCLARSSAEDLDLAVAVAEVSGESVRVQVWCAPKMASGSVYRSNTGGFGPLVVPGALLQLQFGDDSGTWLAALSQMEKGVQAVFLLNSTGVFRAPDVAIEPGSPSSEVLVRIENMWLIEGIILIDVLARKIDTYIDPETGMQAASADALALHFTLAPPLGASGLYGAWRASTVDLMQFGRGDYWYCKPAGWEGVLFLPKYAGLLPFRVELARSGVNLLQKASRVLKAVDLPAMQEAALSLVGQSENAILAVSKEGWDWLKQIRLSTDGFVEGVFGSTRVDYTLEIDGRCDERGCEGCLNLQVQRLCNAYSRCALVNCIGTPVHQRRPLCGIGGLLRQTGRMYLVSTQGAWAIFTEMLTLTMRLSLLTVKEAYLMWPEDKFLCYICQAKDRTAVFFSIFTSTLNSALQLGNADIGYMYGGASNVDTNADAVLTISSTAINSFMHQLFLYPLYGLAVTHQILMCQVSGVIALVPADKFVLRIRGADGLPPSDLIGGQCLSVGAQVLADFPKDDQTSLGYMITSMVSNALQLLVVQQIEPSVHILDGFLAYVLGLVKSLGMLIQSQTMAKCNPPDFFLQDVVNCPCGDQRLRISPARRADSTHWCTGVLGMIDSNNQPYYVYNKHTYEELQAMSSGMKAYVECVSSSTSTGGYSCQPPSTPFFSQQGVTVLNVLVKCRENFVKRRWDPAAYVLYQESFWDLLHFEENDGVPTVPSQVTLGVRDCLANGDASVGSLAQRCLEGYLLDAGISADDYWSYERLDDSVALLSGPEFTDGCLVFSGPAKQNIPTFENCVDGSTSSSSAGCSIPQHLWTPRSSNDVPLATQHRVVSRGQHRDGLVQTLYAQARAKVLSAIQAGLDVWEQDENPAVKAEFFSVEGDVLHQTMDCIMMGPYSRMDYWPIPDCSLGDECLTGPYWSRDERAGAARDVDPATCTAPSSLPYTCGSPGRQSLIRYLVLNLLPSGFGQANQNGTNVAMIIRSTLAELAATWDDTDGYGCLCESNNGSTSPACCLSNPGSPLLPPHLNTTFTSIKAQTVLQALEDDMHTLYELALENREVWMRYMQDVGGANETVGYDWSASQRVEDEARFDPTKPASTYSAQDEALSPLMDEDSTLWDVCHASMKQVFFTLPMSADGTVLFDEPGEQFNGDPATLPDQVRRFTREAFFRSPLFRHYLPRHAPSESLMCEKRLPSSSIQEEGTVSYNPFVQDGETLLDSKDLPPVNPAFHPQRFSLGESGGSCLCGWQQVSPARCRPPTRSNTYNKVCAVPGVQCGADYTYDMLGEQALILAAFAADWYCPEFELSPSWGYLDPSANEQWLALNMTTLVTSSRDLYRHGRGGLRPGNLNGLSLLAKADINPKTREIPLERARLTTCDPPPPAENLLEPFLDNLFPANHGVDDAAPTAYCLRYAIELARLEVLNLLLLPRLQSEIFRQQEAVEVWRRRCGAQLHLLHLCVNLRAFRPLLVPESRNPTSCPFFALTPTFRTVYSTPSCLVSVDGVFYDPCAGCLVCAGPTVALLDVETTLLADTTRCPMSFDPRRLLRTDTAPLGWVDGVHPLPDPETALLDSEWVRDLLEIPGATGNILRDSADPWFGAEGPMGQNSEFCDTVMDWWPDEWSFPIGYHVTVPCEANTTAYRSFSQAFALDEATNTLVYQHDLLRDADLVDSHFGGAGLCRSGTFGMPMHETNNMRYCTRMPLDDTEDFTLPLRYGQDTTDLGGWTDWKCTESSTQLPWPTTAVASGSQQSSRLSIGTIPNMPPETSGTYPATDAEMYEVGPWQDIINAGGSWGISPETLCQDYRLLTCKTDSACPTGYHCKGRVCSDDLTRACTQDSGCSASGTCDGVCLLASVQCIRHSECPGEKMCSGVGTCETPVLAVQNRLLLSGENISLGLAAHEGECGAGNREFSLLQASYWGNTGKDLLRVHGMCSFQDWFKYTSTYSQDNCTIPPLDGDEELEYFELDQEQCYYVDLSKPSSNLTRSWWPAGNMRPDVMFMRPTNCDRDYERLQGFAHCAPVQGHGATLLYNDERLEQTLLSFDQFARLTDSLGSKVMRLARMQEANVTRVGFLGLSGRIEQVAELQQEPFVPCGVVGQCFPARFTVNGQEAPRLVESSSGGNLVRYVEKDAFICGAFGILGPAGCTLDVDRQPLYRYLCAEGTKIPSCMQLGPDTTNGINRICSAIGLPYQALNNDRIQVLSLLRELFYVFPASKSLEEYLQLTTCMSDMYDAMSARATATQGATSLGVYFPFMFSLYELPFDWFYQCVVLSGFTINPNSHVQQNCRAYATRADHAATSYRSLSPAGDSFFTYLQFVRGGYTKAGVDAYKAQQATIVSGIMEDVTSELADSMFGTGSGDFSYPRCSRHLRWRVGPYGEPYTGDLSTIPEARALIWNWYDQQSCSLNWHEQLLDKYALLGVQREAWIESLTVPDPTLLTAQDGAAGKDTMIQTAARYMLSNMGVIPVDLVQSQSTGAIKFNGLPPFSYDHDASPVPTHLQPSPSISAGTTHMDESVNRTCVFPPVLDPAFASVPGIPTCTKVDAAQGSRVDRIQTCNNINCSTIPVLYQRNGKFKCRYVAEAVISDLDCNQDNFGCHVQVMDRIYTALVELYYARNPSSPVLPVTVFPWFQPRAWVFDSIDLSQVLDHERNIQPNMERSVMCEITTSESQAIRFTSCNNPHYLRLQRHVRAHYKHDGGVQVPSGAQLEWPLSRSLFTGGFLLYYTNQNRSIRQRYMDGLFDDETVCKGDPAEHVCRLGPPPDAIFESVNPWLLGNFNPYELCDVDFTGPGEGTREYIDSYCLDQGNSLCQSFRLNSPDTCAVRNQRLVQQTGVPRSIAGVVNDYNLCAHTVEENVDGCLHDQGLLGGFDGLPVAALLDSSITMLDGTPYEDTENYTVAKNLYENSEWSIPRDFRNGLYSGTNPLWEGKVAPYGYLRMDENEIGGHRIGVAVYRVNETSDTISVMLVERINFNIDASKRFLDEAGSTSRPVREWVADLQPGMQREHEKVRRLYSLEFPNDQLSASCPLQRWTFYSGGYTPFSPSIPAAQRARRLFHRIHGGRFAHPTMEAGPSGLFLGSYKTSNGFCACPVVSNVPQIQCRVPIKENSQCSLKYTMQALLGIPEDVRTSYVFPTLTNERSTRHCDMMLDWPVVDGILKDGSTLTGAWDKASDPVNKVCHVLDRFRPFQYRYKPAPSLTKDTQNRNTAFHGACSTSRVVTLQQEAIPGPFSRCLRTQMGTSTASFACNTTTSTFSMPRRERLTLAQILALRGQRRTSCASCAPPPRFRSQQGRPIAPESSFGRLVRLSPERALAKDIRDLLCPPNASGPCAIPLNESAWQRGEFMRNYMLNPQNLFLNKISRPATRQTTAQQTDADWTGKGWVYCPTARALASGEGCMGTISRQQWIQHKTSLCPRMIRSYSSSVVDGADGDPMARTPFCSIDKTTDAICKAIAEARLLVIQANCIARDDSSCMPSPYVYHPASYEPSNNAWIHDSVRSFYQRIDSRTCQEPSSRSNQALLAFARMYQQECPANALNMFAGLIQGIRVLVVDVALIFTTLISLVFNGFQLLVASGYFQARMAIAKHWAYIRSKARASLDAFGDIMIDALLNSGTAGARIMGFLEKTCLGLNEAAEWFLNVWCNYIQRYTLQFLTGMRRFLGISGATFDMIQDFIDQVFQGILPAAFVAKYANSAFQTALMEKYSEPSDERKKQKTGTSYSVPDSAARLQQSRTYARKGVLTRVMNYGKRAASAVAGVSKYLAAGLLAWEAIDLAMSIAEEERLRQLYPDNFTLFDMTSIVDVIDELQEFILSPLSQQTCMSFQLKRKVNPDAPAFSCAKVSLDTYSATTAGTTSLEPTMCWANAAPSVGENSMFACTGASTCCETAECTTKILCASCPEPALTGITRYGCDSLRLRCSCSQTVVSYSRCAANRQCSLDSQCELVSSLNGVSYGTIPCASCPNTARVMCLMPPTGMPARCSCMLAGGPSYDLCNDKTGLRTPVDGSRLCAYLHNRRSGATAVWAFDMDDLIMLPCVQVSLGICGLVYPPGQADAPIRMVVAETVRFSSGGGRRMLLMDDDQVAPEPAPPVYDAYESEYELTDSKALHDLLMAPGWNTTAAPCSSLALAYQLGRQKLGILETHVLHQCGFWRYVGRRVIARYNLSVVMAGHDTFLLSMDDFVFAVMKREVARALLFNPGIFASALMHHPSMKPMRAVGVMVANQLEYYLWEDGSNHNHSDSQSHEREENDSSSEMRPDVFVAPRRALRNGMRRRNQTEQKKQAPGVFQEKKHGRRLLAVQDVLAYSVGILRSPDNVGVLPPRVFNAWSSEHFTWPPRYNYTLEACPIALTTLDILTHVAQVNKLYFTNFEKQRPDPPRSLRANLPDLSWTKRLVPNSTADATSSWASTAFRWLLGVFDISPSQLVAFFNTDEKWSLTWILNSLTRCDLASTLTCARAERDILMSTIVFAIFFIMVRFMSQALGLSSLLSLLFLLSYPWFILWYAYGLAPSCFPLLPTCLLGDLIRTVELVLPPKLTFHPSLLCDGQNQTCLRSCTYLEYVDWVDPLAFSICDVDDKLCSDMLSRGPSGLDWLDAPFYSPLLASMARFQLIIRAGDAGGYRVCAWVSFVSVVPALALVISGLAVLAALVSGGLDILPFLANFVCQAFVFYDTPA